MNNKIIIGVAAAILSLTAVVWIARPNSQDNNNNTANVGGALAGVLESEEQTFDFGEISMAAGNVNHSFTIKNTGENSVTISKMYTSCMCTTAKLKLNGKSFGPYGMPGHGAIPKINQKLDPGEEAIVEAIFDPAAHGPAGVGFIQRSIILENSAGEPLQFGFSANVAP